MDNIVDKRCRPMPMVNNADVPGDAINKIGAVVNIKCHDGYRTKLGKDSFTITCQSDEMWSNEWMTCKCR